ncbi:MAG: hypothetical protein U0359_20990 [Byssovorax sp.]
MVAAFGCGGSGSSGSSSTTGGTGGSGTTSSSTTNPTTTSSGSGGGSSTTTTGSSGNGGFGGSAQGGDCGMCVNDKMVFAQGTACNQAYVNCAQDQTCADFQTCIDQCLLQTPQTVECWSACEQAASAVSNLYQPFVDCFCTSCKTECAAACP